jgi:hypothetical protein
MLYNVYNEACLYNHCCSGKSISITYSESVFVPLGIHELIRKTFVITIVSAINIITHYENKQDRQCCIMFTMRHVCTTIVVVENL